MVLVVSTADSSNAGSGAETSNDGFSNALDAILEDWRLILDG
jgi:hypothetical protein